MKIFPKANVFAIHAPTFGHVLADGACVRHIHAARLAHDRHEAKSDRHDRRAREEDESEVDRILKVREHERDRSRTECDRKHRAER